MSLNGANKSNLIARTVPNLSRLIPEENGHSAMALSGSNGTGDNRGSPEPASSTGEVAPALNYEDSDLNAITRSQMSQDLIAYRYDLEFCQTQLTSQPDLSGQEIRTLQIRILDCGHNIRHCRHRIQTLDAQARISSSSTSYSLGTTSGSANTTGGGGTTYRVGGTAASTGKHKRQRIRKSEGGEASIAGNNDNGHSETAAAIGGGGGGGGEAEAEADGADDSIVAASAHTTASPAAAPTNVLQRLGYWDCRLCRSRKYLEAGSNRVPSAPCKWPLKDISKMINHFLDLHTEHAPKERCHELGDALARNRGPFEYWLTRTKGQDIENVSLIDDYVRLLQDGSLPDIMRGLLRSATLFPNTVSNSYKK
ncbi:hypothetical protein F4777DRAFT_579089 [Nemania sp. FL0916]|nr:hypothetical protein F4777DRAFT_579089 [Nemania sp. FL0916]